MVKFANHCPPRPSVFFCFTQTHPCYCAWLVRCACKACQGRFQKQISSSGSHQTALQVLRPTPSHLVHIRALWCPKQTTASFTSTSYFVHKAWCKAGTQSTQSEWHARGHATSNYKLGLDIILPTSILEPFPPNSAARDNATK